MSKSNEIKARRNEVETIVHASHHESDCPILPDPVALEHYQKIDSSLIEWFKTQTHEEAQSRRSFYKTSLWLVFIANMVGYFVTGGVLFTAVLLVVKEQYIGASAAGAAGALALVVSLLNKNKQK